MNALCAKKRSQQMRTVLMEKSSKKYFPAKCCFLCNKLWWGDLARINIFSTCGIDCVTVLLNQKCAGLKVPKQNLFLSWYFRAAQIQFLLNLSPKSLNLQFIVQIEWNRCQYDLALKFLCVSRTLNSLLLLLCMGYCNNFP